MKKHYRYFCTKVSNEGITHSNKWEEWKPNINKVSVWTKVKNYKDFVERREIIGERTSAKRKEETSSSGDK